MRIRNILAASALASVAVISLSSTVANASEPSDSNCVAVESEPAVMEIQ
jgi:hypothetical protein